MRNLYQMAVPIRYARSNFVRRLLRTFPSRSKATRDVCRNFHACRTNMEQRVVDFRTLGCSCDISDQQMVVARLRRPKLAVRS